MTHGEHHSSEFNAVLKDIPNIRFLDVIKDAHIRSAFASFNQTQVSNETFLIVAILITLSSVVFMFRFRAFLMSDGYDREELIAGIVLTATIATLIIIVWILWYLKRKSVDPKRRKALKSLYNIQPVLQVILPIGISFFYGLQLIIRVRGGQCDSDKLYLHMLMCNPNHNTNGLPEETLAQLMLMPIVFHIILRDSLVGTFFISYLMSLASVSITAFMLNFRQVMPFLLVYFFFSTVIHYDNQRQNLSLFYLAEKLKFSLSENERLADETHASELRHMIANVAHDLKTPLTSFLSGVEFIAQVVTDWDERLSDPAKSLNTTENIEFTSESLSAIHGCLESIRNTNSFMIMTINRCIDFTKASKGLKLIPKLETIDLQETVDLPIKVMRDFKSHLAINLLPIAPEICTHVISDRQWLQENLLCLMSNAVKYSSKGTVEICVTLVTLPFVKPTVEKPITSIKPTNRPKKTSLNKGRVAPDENSGRSRLGSIGGSSNGGGSAPGSPKTTILVTSASGKNAFLGANLFSAANNSFKDLSNPSSVNEAMLDSLKVRKLSNFVFNHDYSTMGRSRIFSDKELNGEDVYDGSGKSHKVNSGTAMIEEENEGDDDEEGLFLKIEVQDTGIGLSEEAMRSLFTPFKQAQRLAGGTGLGLYSLAKRIEALCGHYGVSNRKDNKQGSLFWFAIPYRPDIVFAQSMLKQNKMRANSMRGVNHAAHAARIAAINANVNSPNAGNELIDLEAAPPIGSLLGLGSNSRSNNSLLASEPSGGASSGRPSSALSTSSKHNDHPRPVIEKLSILLVDDSLSILKMTTMMLKRSGHKVEQADNGAEGLDMILRGYEKMNAQGVVRGARQCPYDVVLMDLQMPVMDGFEAIRRLRAAEKQLKPVIEYDVNIGRSNDTESIYHTASEETAGMVKDFAHVLANPSRTMIHNDPNDQEGNNEVDSRKTADSSRSGNNGARIGSMLLQGNNNKHAAHMLAPGISPTPISTPTTTNTKSARMRRQFVIGVSANSDHGTMMEAMKAGFDAFIGKPFSIDAFYEVLQSHQTKEREKNANT